MPDTRRSLSALQTLLADNTAGDISAQDARDFLVSVDGENSVQTGAFGSIPGSGQKAGDLYLPSDGFCAYRWSGSAWVPWGPLFPFTAPVSGDFTAVNGGGTSSLTTTYGGLVLADSATTGSDNLRVYKKAAPSTPYTITAAILAVSDPTDTTPGFDGGLCFRESGSGKLHVYALTLTDSSPGDVVSVKYTNPTTFSATYHSDKFLTRRTGYAPCVWLRIADDGTNRICSAGVNGETWWQTHSVGRTDFLTADEVGFYIDPWGAAGALTLLSWKEG